MGLASLQRDGWSHKAAGRLMKTLSLCGGDRVAAFGHIRAALYYAVERGKQLKRTTKKRAGK